MAVEAEGGERSGGREEGATAETAVYIEARSLRRASTASPKSVDLRSWKASRAVTSAVRRSRRWASSETWA